MSRPNPCPFCGHSDVIVQEGSTFRWCVAVCEHCDARGPEVRGRVDLPGSTETAESLGAAFDAWNRRADPRP